MNKDIEAYLRAQRELIAKHHGKTAVFHKGKLVAVEKDFKRAIRKAKKKTKGREFFVAELYTAEEQSAAILVILP